MCGTCRKKETVKCRSVEKICPTCPRGELKLTLHLPTRRQGGTRLTSCDWRVNPNLAAPHRYGPLIMAVRQNNSQAGEEANGERRHADSRGEERKGERTVIEGNPVSLILRLFLILADFLPPSAAWLSPVCLWQGHSRSFNCYCFLPATIETFKSRSSPAMAAASLSQRK